VGEEADGQHNTYDVNFSCCLLVRVMYGVSEIKDHRGIPEIRRRRSHQLTLRVIINEERRKRAMVIP
jgi:hypothetical protein